MKADRDWPDVTEGVEYDAETDTYRTHFDESVIDPSMAVVRAMSEVVDAPASELPPLYDAVDPATLDRPSGESDRRRPANEGVVEFAYCDHRVVVKRCGIIKIRPLSAADSPSEE